MRVWNRGSDVQYLHDMVGSKMASWVELQCNINTGLLEGCKDFISDFERSCLQHCLYFLLLTVADFGKGLVGD